MTKLCPRGKAAAKRKFKVYPSAYANAYASKICAGKIKDPSGVKRKDFKGPKPNADGNRSSQQRKMVSNARKVMAKSGLKKWFNQKWVDIGSRKKVAASLNAVDQNKKRTLKESIQNVCL